MSPNSAQNGTAAPVLPEDEAGCAEASLSGGRSSVLYAVLFGLLLLATFSITAYVAHLEVVVLDSWGYYFAGQEPGEASPSAWLQHYLHTYKNGNPRLGMLVIRPLFVPGPLPEILCGLHLVLLEVVVLCLALGRWPDPRQKNDLLVLLGVGVFLWAGIPNFGVSFFYRPVLSNYVFGALLTLAMFVPLRIHLGRLGSAWRQFSAPSVLCLLTVPALAFLAGLCNEHTGPTVILFFASAAVWSVWRTRAFPPLWIPATWAAYVWGYYLLYTAPGQYKRYDGLAEEQTVKERILDREPVWVENLDLVLAPLKAYGWVMLAALVCCLLIVYRAGSSPDRSGWRPPTGARLVEVLLWILGGLSVFVVLLASPKVGTRLLLFSGLCFAVATSILWDTLKPASLPGPLRVVLVFCLLLVLGTCWRMTTVIYEDSHAAFEDRVQRMKANPGIRLWVRRYEHAKGELFFGEDFLAKRIRDRVAKHYGLTGIRLERSQDMRARQAAALEEKKAEKEK